MTDKRDHKKAIRGPSPQNHSWAQSNQATDTDRLQANTLAGVPVTNFESQIQKTTDRDAEHRVADSFREFAEKQRKSLLSKKGCSKEVPPRDSSDRGQLVPKDQAEALGGD